jgi:hypothetical protein
MSSNTRSDTLKINITVFFDSRDASNKGWAYNASFCDADGTEYESGPLPHKRRKVSTDTLMRSLRREYKSSPVAKLVAAKTRDGSIDVIVG